MKPDYDVLIIGSGFGGSVSALRLTEKGYRVGVLEAGRRFADEDFAETSWDLRKFLWAPKLGCYGIQRIHPLKNVMILAGAGVGGGSLNYANTLYVPPDPFFNDQQWTHITDWRDELMPHYDQASRMLGVVENPTFTDADRIVKQVADEMGCGDTFVPTPVGVFFGPDGTKAPGKTVPDPYFGGAGPERTGCLECGCLHDRLPLRRQEHPAEELPRPRGIGWCAGHSDDDGETIRAASRRAVGGPHRAHRQLAAPQTGARYTAKHVILAAGTWGTQHLLFKMRDAGPTAPAVEAPRRADPHQLRVHRRRRATRGRPDSRSDARGGDHVVDPSDVGHPHRAGPLRQGLQRDGAAADVDDRRRPVPRAPMCRVGSSCSMQARRGSAAACCGCSTRVSGASAR